MSKKNSSTKKLIWIVVTILAVFMIGGFIGTRMGWIGGSANIQQVETEIAERRTIIQVVSSSGRIQPEEEVIIRPDVSGEVIELNVREGDFVRAGDVLIRIKPDIYQARIDELNAALLTQKSRLEQTVSTLLQAEIEFLKKKELYDKELISELEYLQSKNNYEGQQANKRAAEFQIQSAEASLRRAEEELAQTVIRAPKDGTITRLSIEQGERVLGNSQMAGTEMMRIARMDQMEILVDVNENDIVNVSVGDSAEIEVDSYQNRLFDGVVTEIANSADVLGAGSAEQVTNYKVKVRVSTPHNLMSSGQVMQSALIQEDKPGQTPPEFKPGMSATVDIQTETVVDVVSVPIQAITVRDFAKQKRGSASAESSPEAQVSEDSGSESSQTASLAEKEDFRRVVFLVVDGKAERVEVETGISDNTHIQVLSGLDAGDEVVTGPYRLLSRQLEDGDQVEKRGAEGEQ